MRKLVMLLSLALLMGCREPARTAVPTSTPTVAPTVFVTTAPTATPTVAPSIPPQESKYDWSRQIEYLQAFFDGPETTIAMAGSNDNFQMTKIAPEKQLVYSCGDTWMDSSRGKITSITRGVSPTVGPFVYVGLPRHGMAFPDKSGIYLQDGGTNIGFSFGESCGVLNDEGVQYMTDASTDVGWLICSYFGCG